MNCGLARNLSYRFLKFGTAMLMYKSFNLISSNPNRRSASSQNTQRKLLGTPSITDPKAKLVTQIFYFCNHIIETFIFVTMILHFTLKFFELFKCFRLVFHQVDILISAQIICEDQKIMIPVVSLNIHRTTYISMYDFQQIYCSLHCSEEQSLSHLAHEAWFASINRLIIK